MRPRDGPRPEGVFSPTRFWGTSGPSQVRTSNARPALAEAELEGENILAVCDIFLFRNFKRMELEVNNRVWSEVHRHDRH